MREHTHFRPQPKYIPGFEYRLGIMQNLYRLSAVDPGEPKPNYITYNIEDFCPHHGFKLWISRFEKDETSCVAIRHVIDSCNVDEIVMNYVKTWKVLVPSYYKLTRSLEGKTGKYWWYLDSKKMNWTKFEKALESVVVALV